jgi:hypothetical protein
MIAVKILTSFGGTVDGKAASYADGEEAQMSEASAAQLEMAGLVQRIERPAVKVMNPPTKAQRQPAVKGEA